MESKPYSTRRVLEILREKKGKGIRLPDLELPKSKISVPAPVRIRLKDGEHDNPRTVCHSVYNYLQNSGLIIAPEKDIKLGKIKSYKLNDSGSEKIFYSEHSYNSYLLFTHLVSLMDKGSMIFFGPPGTGKTTAPELVTRFLYDIPVNKIQEGVIYGNPELTLTDMVATTHIGILLKTGDEVVMPREFMKSMIRIIDEVNRITPGKLSILYQVADRGFTTYKGHKIIAPPGPLFATANAADSGNYPMPVPFLDRFDVAVNSNFLNANYFGYFGSRKKGKTNNNLEYLVNIPPSLTAKDIVKIRKEINAVGFEPDALGQLVYFILDMNSCYQANRDSERKTKASTSNKKPGALCADCHYLSDKNICSCTKQGLSTRTYWSTYTFSKAFAWWLGKKEVSTDIVEAIIPYLVHHKIEPTNIALEKDPVYVNDRISFVKDMFEIASNQYDIVKQQFPIDDLSRIIANIYSKQSGPGVKSEDIETMLADVKNIDSAVKFSIASALLDIKNRIENGSNY